ncbi:hypothetical protein FRB90_006151 [Tulasnella sp. 427]|nr:hypothetical protein FRB90_006151 [Tulasnella sp. 427]
MMSESSSSDDEDGDSRPKYFSHLRNPSLAIRTRLQDPDGRPLPWMITEPWDRDAAADNHSRAYGLVPPPHASPSAMELRYTHHGGKDKYDAKIKAIKIELESGPDSRLSSAAVGTEHCRKKLDKDARVVLALEVIKYRRRFPRQDSNARYTASQYSDWKGPMWDRVVKIRKDLDPDARVFSEEKAERKWWKAIDQYFRGCVQACDGKEKKGPGFSRNSKLEALLCGSSEPLRTPCELWADHASEADWAHIHKKNTELTEEWRHHHPHGRLEDNRLQLFQAAKRKVFEEICKADDAFYSLWESKAYTKLPLMEVEKAQHRSASVATMSFLASRIADNADVSISFIITGDFGAGMPNAYVAQYGFPKGEALVDQTPGSAWQTAVTPLIANFLGWIQRKDQTPVQFGDVSPNVNTEALDDSVAQKPAEPEVEKPVSLAAYPTAGRSLKGKLVKYINANIIAVRGLAFTPWSAVSNNPHNYLRNLPDTHFDCYSQMSIDPKTGKPLPQPAEFRNPKNMTKEMLHMYDQHIKRSQSGEIPIEEQFAFVSQHGVVYPASQAMKCNEGLNNSAGNKSDRNNIGENDVDNEDDNNNDDDDTEDLSKEVAAVDNFEQHEDRIREKKPNIVPILDEDTVDGDFEDQREPSDKATVSAADESVVELPPLSMRLELDLSSATAVSLDAWIRRCVAIIPWKGGEIPVADGPSLPAALEIVLLDEVTLFKTILVSSPSLCVPLDSITATPRLEPLHQVLLEKFVTSLANPEETPPRFETDRKHFGDIFDTIVTAFLTAAEDSLMAFLCPETVLEWNLGGTSGLLFLVRTCASLALICNSLDHVARFHHLSSRLHLFLIILVYVRRLYLNVKHVVHGSLLPSMLPHSPIAPLLATWSGLLYQHLGILLRAIAKGNDALALHLFSKDTPFDPNVGSHKVYDQVAASPWFSAVKPRKVWTFRIGATASLFVSAVAWLKKIVVKDPSFQQVCCLGKTILVVGLAHSSHPRWHESPSWPVLLTKLSDLQSSSEPAPGPSTSTPPPQRSPIPTLPVSNPVQEEAEPTIPFRGTQGHSDSPAPFAPPSPIAASHPAPMRPFRTTEAYNNNNGIGNNGDMNHGDKNHGDNDLFGAEGRSMDVCSGGETDEQLVGNTHQIGDGEDDDHGVVDPPANVNAPSPSPRNSKNKKADPGIAEPLVELDLPAVGKGKRKIAKIVAPPTRSLRPRTGGLPLHKDHTQPVIQSQPSVSSSKRKATVNESVGTGLDVPGPDSKKMKANEDNVNGSVNPGDAPGPAGPSARPKCWGRPPKIK